MEELDERLTDSQQHTELLDLIARHLLPVTSEEAGPDAYVGPETGAGQDGRGRDGPRGTGQSVLCRRQVGTRRIGRGRRQGY
jgi:hypothetical protein